MDTACTRHAGTIVAPACCLISAAPADGYAASALLGERSSRNRMVLPASRCAVSETHACYHAEEAPETYPQTLTPMNTPQTIRLLASILAIVLLLSVLLMIMHWAFRHFVNEADGHIPRKLYHRLVRAVSCLDHIAWAVFFTWMAMTVVAMIVLVIAHM